DQFINVCTRSGNVSEGYCDFVNANLTALRSKGVCKKLYMSGHSSHLKWELLQMESVFPVSRLAQLVREKVAAKSRVQAPDGA
uniref:Uncharacterized protein n=1 Tax=Romanomermis culicivorax TaxID=13658 RepID=A0A915JYV7_ROMCU